MAHNWRGYRGAFLAMSGVCDYRNENDNVLQSSVLWRVRMYFFVEHVHGTYKKFSIPCSHFPQNWNKRCTTHVFWEFQVWHKSSQCARTGDTGTRYIERPCNVCKVWKPYDRSQYDKHNFFSDKSHDSNNWSWHFEAYIGAMVLCVQTIVHFIPCTGTVMVNDKIGGDYNPTSGC